MDDERNTPPDGIDIRDSRPPSPEAQALANVAVALAAIASPVAEAASRFDAMAGHARLAAMEQLVSELRRLGDWCHDAARVFGDFK